jgi:hypothetical protein
MLRREVAPVYVPAANEDPLAHFPPKMTDQIVNKADFQSPVRTGWLSSDVTAAGEDHGIDHKKN